LFASARSAGRQPGFTDRQLQVKEVTPGCLDGYRLVPVGAGTAVSREVVPRAAEAGAAVVDKSSAYRLSPQVPLVVPEVNLTARAGYQGIIANPNCTTIQPVEALAPLARAAGLERVGMSSYQSVAGTELTQLSQGALAGDPVRSQVYPYPIPLDLLPHIDSFDDQECNGEERKLMAETRKILDLPELHTSATVVRVLAYRGHDMPVMVEPCERLTRA